MLDFRIHTFLTACETMNFTRAADELHITQPAVSQHIKYLEKYYGAKLFTQDGKKLLLTDAGRLLYEKMNLLKNDELKLVESLGEPANMPQTISFGVTMTIGEYAIADPISRYLAAHPKTDVKIHFANTSDLLSSLEQGVIDFALVEGYFPKEQYDSMVWQSVDFIAVCSAQHTFSKEPRYLKDLFNERILIREPGSGTRNILERNLAIHGYDVSHFTHYLQIENMHSIIQLLLLDCGITFLYKAAVKRELEEGTIREIKLRDFSMKHDFAFLWQKESIFSERIQKICSELI
ncbi:MAG: LysR family transcriptional regulator [Eubacterium sp.]|nr:LysR family transcriptional regulator [Eubacterium sp.]